MTRPNQKKTNMYWFIPSQKKTGAKTPKKNSLKPGNASGSDRSHLNTRVQESYLADANISKPVKYRARHWSCLRHQDGYRRIRLIGNSILNSSRNQRVTSWKNHSPSNVADASTSQTALRQEASDLTFIAIFERCGVPASHSMGWGCAFIQSLASRERWPKPLSPTGILVWLNLN